MQKLLSNQQKLAGYFTQLIFELETEMIRVKVAIMKLNGSEPIQSQDLDVELLDQNAKKMVRSKAPEENLLVETQSAGTTAHAIYEFQRAPGQNPHLCHVQLKSQSKLFLAEDSMPLS